MPPVATLALDARIKVVVTNAAGKLPAAVGRELLKLIESQALAVMAGVPTVWALAHFVGVGVAADLVLLVVGVAALGGIALEAGQEIAGFVSKTMQPRTEADLDAAGSHLAKAVTLIGVQAVMAILLKRRPTTFEGNAYRPSQFANGPRILGTFRYKPTIKRGPIPTGEMGYTTQWGDIRIESALTLAEQRVTLYHELIHRVLTPKLYALRQLRIAISQNGYANSHLLRYLEEAMCETYALLRANGFSKQRLLEGVRFPIVSDYTTVAALGGEVKGLLLGPINVGGMIYNVFYGTGRPDDL
jgi:hypothetical protein